MTQPGKCPASTTPKNGRTPDLRRFGGSHGVGLVPETLTVGGLEFPPCAGHLVYAAV